MRAAIAFAILLGLPRIAGAEPTKYTFEDLKALGESQGWQELLEHAEDVRPSERKQPWKDLLEKAAVGTVDQYLTQKKLLEAFGTAEQVVTRFPTLKQSKSFMAKRREAGLAALGECFLDQYAGSRCIDELDKFTKLDPNDAELQFGAGKLVVDKGRMYASAPPFFARAFTNAAQRKTGCKDKSVIDAVLRAFGQPPDYDNTKAAAQIAFDQCYAELKEPLLTAFYASGGYESRNLCRGLVDKKAKLTDFQVAYCQDQLAK
jgi:hypothetical protein